MTQRARSGASGAERAPGRYGPRNAAVSLQITRGPVEWVKSNPCYWDHGIFDGQTKRRSRGSLRNRLRGIPAQIAELRPDLDRPGLANAVLAGCRRALSKLFATYDRTPVIATSMPLGPDCAHVRNGGPQQLLVDATRARRAGNERHGRPGPGRAAARTWRSRPRPGQGYACRPPGYHGRGCQTWPRSMPERRRPRRCWCRASSRR